jgi:alkylation response protein AidB-like acyl-CoA dehydrogenase
MNSFLGSNEWKNLFRKAIDWDTIISLYHSSYPTTEGHKNKEEVINSYEELLLAIGKWASTDLKARARQLDFEGPGRLENGKTIHGKALAQSYEDANNLGLFNLFIEHKYGGMGIPTIIGSLMFTHMFRYCLATGTQLSFVVSIADMIERFCDEKERERLLPQFLEGKLSGAMCLTEPGSGSDLGSLRTSAKKQEDGTYLLNGTKIFITNGGGGVCFVLARIIGAPAGLDGISMFLVEQKTSSTDLNYRVAKIEEKMGFHGSFTCELVFENSVAKLVGKENEGFKYMLHLMNESRLGVGLQCLGGMESTLEYAKNYAATRIQFGKPVAELPLMKRNLTDWETELDAFRVLIFDTMSYYEIYQRLDLKKRHTNDLSEKELQLFKKATKKVRRRTPLVKYYGSETYTVLTTKTIQVLGGYGFMKDYDAERFHRDSFAPLLYEGTSQIQALMALKDVIKYLMKNPARYLKSLVGIHPLTALLTPNQTFNDFKSIHYYFKKKFLLLILNTMKPQINLRDIDQITQFFNSKSWNNQENIEKLMVHAETLIQALSYIETLRVLSVHSKNEPKYKKLFQDYHDLIYPRLQAIYCDWEIRAQ